MIQAAIIVAMTLTGKQKRQLKAIAQTKRDDCQLGKSGITEQFTRHVGGLLDKQELVKLRFADVEGAARKELAEQICLALGAECVHILGRTMLLYRANPELASHKRALAEREDEQFDSDDDFED